jgi:hypothetical protein
VKRAPKVAGGCVFGSSAEEEEEALEAGFSSSSPPEAATPPRREDSSIDANWITHSLFLPPFLFSGRFL